MYRFLIFATGLLCALQLHATILRPPSFESLVNRSELIFRGRVVSKEMVSMGEGSERRIVTLITFSVDRALKGQVASSLQLAFYGGEYGGRKTIVVGQPKYAVGDEGVFFVENRFNRLCPLLGMRHGSYRIVSDENGQTRRILRDDHSPLSSVQGVQVSFAQEPVAGPKASEEGGITVESFESAILHTIQARRLQ